VTGVPLVFTVGATHDRVALPVCAVVAALTVTVADCEAEPPAPLQVSVNLVVALSAAVVCEPKVPSLPVQPPEALQALALLDDQVNVDFAPLATVFGLALKLTTGAAALTVTVADCEAEPPLPLQLKI
jgi:hypothetical protein